MYSYIELIPENFTGSQWREYYRLREEIHLQYDDTFMIGFENFKDSVTHQIRNNGFSIFIFMKEDVMIGYLRYWITNPGHPIAQNNTVLCFVPEKFMEPKLEHVIAKCLFEKMIKEGHQKCIWRSWNTHILSLVKKLSDKPSNSGCWFKLDPKEVSNELLNKWLEAAPEKFGLSVSNYDFIPDELLEETARASNLLVNDMKREDTSLSFHMGPEELKKAQENFRKTRLIPFHLILSDKDKKIVGLSLLVLRKDDPKTADQRLTGIVREWRGKGLAKWMKAKMILIVKEKYPEIVEIKTECFSTNEPMIRLNKALGYELYRTDHDFYIYPKSLESFLKGA